MGVGFWLRMSLSQIRLKSAIFSRPAARGVAAWTGSYRRQLAIADLSCAAGAGWIAFDVRFGVADAQTSVYVLLGVLLPALWLTALELAGAYDGKLLGVGSDEFRRVVNAGVCLTAGVAFVSYATKADVARGYVVLALPSMVVLDLAARYALRKRLHRLRERGGCMRRVVVVGHADVIGELAGLLRHETYHGLSIVAACLVGSHRPASIGGIAVTDDVANVEAVVRRLDADTVAVLACREMIGTRLRDLAWALEKTGTDLCVAPALLDVAGPRTTIRPVAGLPLLHMDHPEFAGSRRVIKAAFDRAVATTAVLFLLPVFAAIALAVKLCDPGPVFFRQTRAGRDGEPFTLFKFRTMVADAEQRRAALLDRNEGAGLLFKMRDDPRITRVGAWLRRYSLDELPQLVNVMNGEMSLVGPRPALPEETCLYGEYVRRRLAVKPGITGLWQVSGRSDLCWEDAVRLDIRYVENWSFVLDLQILWKTWAAVARGKGAY